MEEALLNTNVCLLVCYFGLQKVLSGIIIFLSFSLNVYFSFLYFHLWVFFCFYSLSKIQTRDDHHFSKKPRAYFFAIRPSVFVKNEQEQARHFSLYRMNHHNDINAAACRQCFPNRQGILKVSRRVHRIPSSLCAQEIAEIVGTAIQKIYWGKKRNEKRECCCPLDTLSGSKQKINITPWPLIHLHL